VKASNVQVQFHCCRVLTYGLLRFRSTQIVRTQRRARQNYTSQHGHQLILTWGRRIVVRTNPQSSWRINPASIIHRRYSESPRCPIKTHRKLYRTAQMGEERSEAELDTSRHPTVLGRFETTHTTISHCPAVTVQLEGSSCSYGRQRGAVKLGGRHS
jgi:hypothetical protein